MAESDLLPEASDTVRYWLEQIEGARKWHTDFHERGKKVVDRYLDKREGMSGLDSNAGHRMNVLWSNVETIKPALYSKTPNAKVQRRYRDKDPVGRWAAVVLERALNYTLDAYDCDHIYREAITDYLLPGRGQVWETYEPEFQGAGDAEKLSWECCRTTHIHWKDFLTNPARTWAEVWWVAKREYLTKDEAKAQRLDVSKLTFTEQKEDERSAGEKGESKNKAAIWEIWNKVDGKVYFVSKNSAELLRPAEAPKLKFDGFFPCPRPITATTTTDSILPVPDFVQYQNQAAEIDRLTQKINELTKALKVAGFYDAKYARLPELLTGNENVMIPLDEWVSLQQEGGVEKAVSFMPLKEVIAALQQAYVSRDQAKAVMYEITGISDIVRGASDPNETATAQQIKSQWGGLRIRDRQHDVQRFVRDDMRLKSEIIAEHFQLETLKAMSNAPLFTEQEKQQVQIRQQAQAMAQQNPQQAQALVAAKPQLQALLQPITPEEMQKLREPSWEQVVSLLRDEKLRGFRIDIETDSTIQADEAEEKQARTEYIGAMTSFIQAWGPMIMQAPQFAPLAGEMMLFGSRAFKTADALESAIEEAVDSLSQQAKLGPPAPPVDPKMELEAKKHAFAEKQHADKMTADQQRYEVERQDKLAAEERAHQFEREKHTTEVMHRDRDFGAAQQAQTQEAAFRNEDRQAAREDDEVGHMRAIDLKSVDRNFVMEDRELDKKQAEAAIAPIAEAIKKMAEDNKEALNRIAEIVSAPKEINIERDKSGKITGGTAKPQVTLN